MKESLFVNGSEMVWLCPVSNVVKATSQKRLKKIVIRTACSSKLVLYVFFSSNGTIVENHYTTHAKTLKLDSIC